MYRQLFLQIAMGGIGILVLAGMVLFLATIVWYLHGNWKYLFGSKRKAFPDTYTYNSVIRIVLEGIREIIYDDPRSFSVFTSRLREDLKINDEAIESLIRNIIPRSLGIGTLNYFEIGRTTKDLVTASDIINAAASELKRIGKFQGEQTLAKPLV